MRDAPISLDTIGGGAAIELFDDEMRRVLDNILDVNTKAESLREVRLTVKIKPNADRGICNALIEVSSKLASPEGAGTVLYVGRREGVAIAIENNPKQPNLFDQPRDTVVRLTREEGISNA